jgi:hypothetical protein
MSKKLALVRTLPAWAAVQTPKKLDLSLDVDAVTVRNREARVTCWQ